MIYTYDILPNNSGKMDFIKEPGYLSLGFHVMETAHDAAEKYDRERFGIQMKLILQ